MTTRLVKVSDLAKQIRGVTYDKSEASLTPQPGHIPILRAGNIGERGLDFSDLIFVPAQRVNTAQLLQENDVLVATSSGSLDVVGKAARVVQKFDGGFGAFCKVLRPGPNVDPRYFAHYFRTNEYRRRVSRLAAGANINNLRNVHLDELLIPLPALGEQRRIADTLDRVDALRVKRREALACLDELADSIFIEMFGDVVSNDRRWRAARVADLVASFESGRSLPDEKDEIGSTHRVLRISSITSGEFRPSESKPAPTGYVPRDSHHVKVGDLLFSRANTSELVGATALVETCPPNVLLPDKLWRFVWHDASPVTPHYVLYLFRRPRFRAMISSIATGSSGSMKNVSQAKVMELPCALPPLELQAGFSAAVSKARKCRASMYEALRDVDGLFQSLQARAFRGEL